MVEAVTETAQKVKEIIAKQLGIDPKKLTEETSLETDLNADSLDAVEIVINLEDAFGVSIPDEEVEKLTTVNKIVKYIGERRRKNE